MRMLSNDIFEEARKSIMAYGRPLERSLLEVYFYEGSKANVVEELKKFQNEDGGFGHGLESDFRLPYSSLMATSFLKELYCFTELPAEILSILLLRHRMDPVQPVQKRNQFL